MRALYLDKALRLETNYPTPTSPPGEALIRVRQAGICNTDLELVKGYMSFKGVPGHEFVGVVEQAVQTRVAWVDTDAGARIHFTAAFRWAELAETELMRRLGVLGPEWGNFPRRRVEAGARLVEQQQLGLGQ